MINDTAHEHRRGGIRLFFGVTYLALLFILGGLVAHRSYHPVWFGRYSTIYVLALVGLFVMVIFWKPLFDFLCRDTRVLWNGRMRLISARRKVLVAILMVVALFGIGEAKLRRARPYIREVNSSFLAQFHPFLQNDLVPNDARLHVNELGFRGDSVVTPQTCDVLIFMLGGSTVLSHDVPYEQSHAARLQQLLNDRYPEAKIVVLNAANEYHVVLHSLIKYAARIRPLKPDIVIMWHGVNDLLRSFYPNRFTMPNTTYRDDYRHFLGPIAGMVTYYAQPIRTPPFVYSAFLSWLCDSLYSDLRAAWLERKRAAFLRETTVEEFPSLVAFEQHLDALLTLMRNDGVAVIVASEPTMYGAVSPSNLWMQKSLGAMGDRYPSVESLCQGMQQFNEKARQLAEQHHMLFLDLDNLLPKDSRYMFDDCHYTKEGNMEVARLLADFLEKHKVIEHGLRGKSSRRDQLASEQTTADRSGDLGQSSQEAREMPAE